MPESETLCGNCGGRGTYGTAYFCSCGNLQCSIAITDDLCSICNTAPVTLKPINCSKCNGTGKKQTLTGTEIKCYPCNGTGKVIKYSIRCSICDGTGKKEEGCIHDKITPHYYCLVHSQSSSTSTHT